MSTAASTVTVVALVKVKPGEEEAVIAVITPVVEQTHQEDGCLKYALHRSKTDPQQFVLIERWASQADLDAHFQQPYVGALLSGLADLLVEPPAIHFLEPTPVGDAQKAAL
jgi:quinol monooxygenase YgiN